jgi:hypothetical protein
MPWHASCPYCGAGWEIKNTSICHVDVPSPTLQRLLNIVGLQDAHQLNDCIVPVCVEHVHGALNMTAPGTQIVLPEMAPMIDEAIEFERERFRWKWCDYGRHVYSTDPSRGKACGFHMRVKRQRRSDGTL